MSRCQVLHNEKEIEVLHFNITLPAFTSPMERVAVILTLSIIISIHELLPNMMPFLRLGWYFNVFYALMVNDRKAGTSGTERVDNIEPMVITEQMTIIVGRKRAVASF